MINLSAKSIPLHNVLRGISELGGEASTPDIGIQIKKPAGYDLGNRLPYLKRIGYVKSKRVVNTKRNLWKITTKGKSFLNESEADYIPYGEYNIVVKGESEQTQPVNMSVAASDAMNELSNILAKNQQHRAILQKIYFEVDTYLKNIEGGR